MKTRLHLLTAIIALLISTAGLTQETAADSSALPFQLKSRFGLVAETPLMYGIGYEGSPHKNFSISLRYGFLTQPNKNILLWSMEQQGTDTLAIDVLRESIKSGQVASFAINGIYKGFYLGAYGQYIHLKGEETIGNLVESATGVDITTLLLLATVQNPQIGNFLALFNPNDPITITSTLWQFGARLGKRIPLNQKWDFNVELAYSFNISSTSLLESDNFLITALSDQVEDFLNDTFREDANFPGINLALMYKF